MNDTSLAAASGRFPTTVWPDVLAAGGKKLGSLFQAYWKPIYVFIRAGGKSREDAKDLTQAFLAHLLDHGFVERARPDRGSFRAYLKGALRFFLIDAERLAGRRKAVAPSFSIDALPADLEDSVLASREASPDRAYDQQWFRCLLDASVEELRDRLARDGKEATFEIFRDYCLDASGGAPTYAEIARRRGLSESDVRNRLTYCRSALRGILRERIAETVQTEEELDVELRAFLGG